MAQKEAEMSFMKEQKEAEMSFMKEEMEKQKEYLTNQIEILMKRAGNNNNNCDESSEREKIQLEYSENTDPVVNENFIAPNFGYKRQYKGESIYIFGRSRECVCRRHTFTHLSSLLFLRDDIKNSW